MKKYYEFMNEISSNELYEGLLAYGLFSEKLPPFLTSKPFYDYCINNNPTFSNIKKEQSYIHYENMRNVNVPRALGIPNPMAYQRLCLHLKKNWDKLIDHFKYNTEDEEYKISRIHIRKKKNTNKVFEMNYRNFKIDGTPEPNLLIGSKYIVNADISTCFPSIYTHSLSWALVGKATAKSTKSDHSKWYNELDFYVRNLTNGETHGILIGPHSSNLISEIILTSIDYELYKRKWKFIRNIDDYTCYVNSYEEGQQFLIDLSDQLRIYGLVLNHKKTKLTQLPTELVEQWVRKMNVYLKMYEDKVMDYQDVKFFLDFSIQLMHENNMNSAIINYAIKVLSKKELTTNAIDYYVKTIFHLSELFPYVVPLLEEFIFIAFNIEKERISEYSNNIYQEGMKNKSYEVISYSIYYSLKYNFNIDSIDFKFIKNSNHCILLLLGFLYCNHKKIQIEVKEFKKIARELVQDEEYFNENWLFVYEALPKSHLKSDWKKLKENRVSFVSL